MNSFLLLVSNSCFSITIERNDLIDLTNLLHLHFSKLEFSTDALTSLAIFD